MDFKLADGVQQAAAGARDADRPSEVVALQAGAIMDHLSAIDEGTLKNIVTDGQLGGSKRVTRQQLSNILADLPDFQSKAGGSAANTIRGLAAGFGVSCDLVGARGSDEWGAMFQSSLKRATVGTNKLRVQQGDTGRCVILSCGRQRTMRTYLDNAVRLGAEDLQAADFQGSKWLLASAYCLYRPNLLERSIELATAAGCRVALDLASFEVVQAFREPLMTILAQGNVALCTCNEDEAEQLLQDSTPAAAAAEHGAAPALAADGTAASSGPHNKAVAALELLAQHCQTAVVTLGEHGCLARSGGQAVVQEPAAQGVKVVDTTGAGDLFLAGFLYGQLRDWSLQKCCHVGCLTGGAVVQTFGAELSREGWQWIFERLHGDLAATVVRDSATAVHQELLRAYHLIERLGRGCVYYGSARLKEASPHWQRAVDLGRQVALLLRCTTWSGGGPGMMEAATKGAMDAGMPVGGIRISREAGTTIRTASYLPAEASVFCRFLSARKVALVDSGVRMQSGDRTAYIFLPGGLGTMDELFELLTLVQLKRLGSRQPVPIILVNWDGFWGPLLEMLQACTEAGTVGAAELRDVVLAGSTEEVLDCLKAHYDLPDDAAAGPGEAASPPRQRPPVHRADSWILRRQGDAAAAATEGPLPGPSDLTRPNSIAA